jgi:hypothetical protein
MGGARRLCILLVVLFAAGGCGIGHDDAAQTNCPSPTPGQPTSSTPVDPRCVVRATEREDVDSPMAGRAWKGVITTTEGGPGFSGTTHGTFSVSVALDGAVTGSGTSHSTYSGAAPIDSRITVTGRRDGGSFTLALAHDPGTRIEVVAPITGKTASGAIDLTGEMGTYSRGTVQLECEDCEGSAG